MMDISIMFFPIASETNNPYQLLIDATKYADKNGFSAVWIPERHFNSFGGIFPNPAVISAALAPITKSIQLRAGSIISPLYDVLRIVENWSVVDNLSNGRIALSFGAGWSPDDFCLFPSRYKNRDSILYEQIQEINILWSGGSIERINGLDENKEIKFWPKPVQKKIPLWISIASNPASFEKAGSFGANVLTHLVNQDLNGLKTNIDRYRAARKKSGHNPETGKVTLMLHTFVSSCTHEETLKITEQPLKKYLAHIIDFGGVKANNFSNNKITEEYKEELLHIAYKKFINGRVLIGNKKHCKEFLDKISNIGVTEIAALIDFGLPNQDVLKSLALIKSLF